MSLPTKQEVIQQAESLSLPERLAFGSKLGHTHAQNPQLKSLIKEIRTYEAPKNPRLDSGTIAISKLLPTQAKNSAKHFDIEQVALAAAVSGKDLEVLEAEVIGPGASNLTFACDRLAKLSPHDEATTEHLFNLALSLPVARRKPLIKSMIKHRHVAVLERLAKHWSSAPNASDLLVSFLHGCSHEVVVTYLPSLIAKPSTLKPMPWLHYCRYHWKAILELMTQDFESALVVDAADEDANKVSNTWSVWHSRVTNRSQNSNTILKKNKAFCQQLIELAWKYPATKSCGWSERLPSIPNWIIKYWKTYSKQFPEQLNKLVDRAVVVQHLDRYVNFEIDNISGLTCAQFLALLDKFVPILDTNMSEYAQLSLPTFFGKYNKLVAKMTWMPDLVQFTKDVLAWFDRYAANRPSLKLKPLAALSSIFNPAMSTIARLENEQVEKIEARRVEAMQKLRAAGKPATDMTVALLGKQYDNIHFEKHRREIERMFMPRFTQVLEDIKDSKQTSKATNFRAHQKQTIESFGTVCSSPSITISAIEEILVGLMNYTFKDYATQESWLDISRGIFKTLQNLAQLYKPENRNFTLFNSPSHVERLKIIHEKALNMMYDLASKNPSWWIDSIEKFIIKDSFSWTITQRFWKLISMDNLKEMVHDKKIDQVCRLLRSVPLSERVEVVTQLMAPSVSTQADRQKLITLLSIQDDATRAKFEQATSSSSPTERNAALARLIEVTTNLPYRHNSSINAYLKDSEACAQVLKSTTTTLAFVNKRIKNATFEDRCIVQTLAFTEEKVFPTVWFAPGVGPAQFAVWLEMLEDHIQNPNMTTDTVCGADASKYTDEFEDAYEISFMTPFKLWNLVIEKAIYLGIMRSDKGLLDFGFQVAAKVGTVTHGAADPLGARGLILWSNIASYLSLLRLPEKTKPVLDAVIECIQKYCPDDEVRAQRTDKSLRALIEALPLTHIAGVQQLYDYLVAQYERELAALQPISLAQINEPPKAALDLFDEEAVLKREQETLIPALLARSPKKVWQVPVLVDYLFNVALKSWAAKNYVQLAWRTRLQLALHKHKQEFKGDEKLYRKPEGKNWNKFVHKIAHDFSHELLSISSSALHLKQTQRFFTQHNPSVLFGKLTLEGNVVDEAAPMEEKLSIMEKVALLGPFSPALLVTASDPAPMKIAPMRGGRGRGRGRGGRAVVTARFGTPMTANTIEAASSVQLSLVRNIVKTWRRGQSPKSNDNVATFIPTLCYGLKALHPNQVQLMGNLLKEALMNTMRALLSQKRMMILWTLLPTTTYADVVSFLQENDSNFEPVPETDEDDMEVETPDASATPAKAEEKSAGPTLALSVVETALKGTTMNDEPLAPLAFLLSPTFLSSNYSRIAIQSTQALMPFVPEGLLTKALEYLLTSHRSKLKTTAHKQIIRFLSEESSVAHWEIFINEWKHSKTHRDVRITILTACFQALATGKPEIVEKAWTILELATTYKEQDVVCSLLQAIPSPMPAALPYSRSFTSSWVLNTRVARQYGDFTLTTVPRNHASHYVEKVLIPLCQRDKGHNGSDLQFLAYNSLVQWSPFLSSPTLAPLLIKEYLLSMLSEPWTLIDSLKWKELDVFKNRFEHLSQVFLAMLQLHLSSLSRAASKSDAESFELLMSADKSVLMPSFIERFVTLLDSMATSESKVTPDDSVKYRRFAVILDLLKKFMDKYDPAAVTKKNCTKEEQDSWIVPLRSSQFGCYFEEIFVEIDLKQIDVHDKSAPEQFHKFYIQAVLQAANQPQYRTSRLGQMKVWLPFGSHDASLPYSKLLLNPSRPDAFNTPVSRAIDLYYRHELLEYIFSRQNWTLKDRMKDWTHFIDQLLESLAGLKNPIVPMVSAYFPDVTKQVINLVHSCLHQTVFYSDADKAALLKWLIDGTIEKINTQLIDLYQPSKYTSRPAIKRYLKSLKDLLSRCDGTYVARYSPEKVPKLLDILCHNGSINSILTKIVQHWVSPGTDNQAKALPARWDLVRQLVSQLLEANLSEDRTPDEQYVSRCVEGLAVVFGVYGVAKNVFLSTPVTWWQVLNTIYTHLFYTKSEAPSIKPFVSASLESFSTSQLLECPATVVTILDTLQTGDSFKHGQSKAADKLWLFSPIKQSYQQHCATIAREILFNLGRDTAIVIDKKEEGSAKPTWRPSLKKLLVAAASQASAFDRASLAAQYLAERDSMNI